VTEKAAVDLQRGRGWKGNCMEGGEEIENEGEKGKGKKRRGCCAPREVFKSRRP